MAEYLLISGSSDIATETANQLVDQGHRVYLTSRTKENVEHLAKRLDMPYAVIDPTDFDAVDDLVAERVESGLAGVVNCSGSLFLKPAHQTSRDEYDHVISANLTSAFALVRAAGKHMAKKGGSVVLISSAAAMAGIPSHEAIAAAKGGIISLTKSAAATYASTGLRFNAVAPGLVETKMTEHIAKNEMMRKASEAMHALSRLGSVKDVASAIIYFLNPDNDWVTGQVLAVDGGLSNLKVKVKA